MIPSHTHTHALVLEFRTHFLSIIFRPVLFFKVFCSTKYLQPPWRHQH